MTVQKALDPPSSLFLSYRREVLGAERVLDLACGRGRHAIAASAGRGLIVALDRHPGHLAELGERAARDGLRIERVRADLESGSDPPLADGIWDVVMVFRYLHRPLCPWIESALRPGGLLLYETFTEAQRTLEGGPRNPAFLLAPGELPGLFQKLEQGFYEERVDAERNQALASLAARRPVS